MSNWPDRFTSPDMRSSAPEESILLGLEPPPASAAAAPAAVAVAGTRPGRSQSRVPAAAAAAVVAYGRIPMSLGSTLVPCFSYDGPGAASVGGRRSPFASATATACATKSLRSLTRLLRASGGGQVLAAAAAAAAADGTVAAAAPSADVAGPGVPTPVETAASASDVA
eukprot:GHUV01020273.1.p2 GENE.GHUV01020273.1~~GHUV01020273.1.p2  ORF type:complete len:168 (+),score=74.20 GHUV01020273.1:244-747(+)